MTDELKRFIDDRFGALRKEITEAFNAARLRIEAADAAALAQSKNCSC